MNELINNSDDFTAVEIGTVGGRGIEPPKHLQNDHIEVPQSEQGKQLGSVVFETLIKARNGEKKEDQNDVGGEDVEKPVSRYHILPVLHYFNGEVQKYPEQDNRVANHQCLGQDEDDQEGVVRAVQRREVSENDARADARAHQENEPNQSGQQLSAGQQIGRVLVGFFVHSLNHDSPEKNEAVHETHHEKVGEDQVEQVRVQNSHEINGVIEEHRHQSKEKNVLVLEGEKLLLGLEVEFEVERREENRYHETGESGPHQELTVVRVHGFEEKEDLVEEIGLALLHLQSKREVGVFLLGVELGDSLRLAGQFLTETCNRELVLVLVVQLDGNFGLGVVGLDGHVHVELEATIQIGGLFQFDHRLYNHEEVLVSDVTQSDARRVIRVVCEGNRGDPVVESVVDPDGRYGEDGNQENEHREEDSCGDQQQFVFVVFLVCKHGD